MKARKPVSGAVAALLLAGLTTPAIAHAAEATLDADASGSMVNGPEVGLAGATQDSQDKARESAQLQKQIEKAKTALKTRRQRMRKRKLRIRRRLRRLRLIRLRVSLRLRSSLRPMMSFRVCRRRLRSVKLSWKRSWMS